MERSQSPLELARALSDHGARRIAAGARAELIAAGAKPRRPAITGRDALTAGELLFITTKTATGHLSSVYRKLEITRRGQLTDALAGPLRDGGEDPDAAAAIS